MVNVGRADETPKQRPAQTIEINGQQASIQNAQQAQQPAAPNCVWTAGEYELPYNSGTDGIFAKRDEQGRIIEEYQDCDMDGSLDIRTTYEYGKYGEKTAMNIDWLNDGDVDTRFEYDEKGRTKRTITFGLNGEPNIVSEHIYDNRGRRTHSMVDENNDGKFDRVEYYDDEPSTNTNACKDLEADPAKPETDPAECVVAPAPVVTPNKPEFADETCKLPTENPENY